MSTYRAPDETAFAKIQADIKARSRKVEPSKGGTGGLEGRGAAVKQTIAHGKMIERIRGLSATTPAPQAQERGKSTPGKPKLREAQVLRACMDILDAHPKVALWWRQNSFALKDSRGVYVRSAFKGCSDILGAMAGSGKLLAIEVKSFGKRPTDDQMAFLENVSRAGGYALFVDDPTMLATWLEHI